MTLLPAVVTRPLVDAFVDAPGPAPGRATAPPAVLATELPEGIPARLVLDAHRTLVLAVPLGVARPLLEADPLTVVVDDALLTGSDPAQRVVPDVPRPRLTLVADGRLADSITVVPGVAATLADGGRALVTVVVERLRITAGSLRGPGAFGSLLRLTWTDPTAAGDHGAAPVPGDPALLLLRKGRA